MNLAFFLTPVADVVCLDAGLSVAEAVGSLSAVGYTAVPLIDVERRYVGTLTAADLLLHLSRDGDPEHTPLAEVARNLENRPVSIDTDIRRVLAVAADQNFVPVVDSRGVLMGIVTRKAILRFFERLLSENGLLPKA